MSNKVKNSIYLNGSLEYYNNKIYKINIYFIHISNVSVFLFLFCYLFVVFVTMRVISKWPDGFGKYMICTQLRKQHKPSFNLAFTNQLMP
jgi:hypothetical protein